MRDGDLHDRACIRQCRPLGVLETGVRAGGGSASAYFTFNITLMRDLAPVGVPEEIFAWEVHRAIWRLRRCGEVESHLVILSE